MVFMILERQYFALVFLALIVAVGVLIYFISYSYYGFDDEALKITGNVPLETRDAGYIIEPADIEKRESGDGLFDGAGEATFSKPFVHEDSGVTLIVSKESEEITERAVSVLVTKPEIVSLNVPGNPVKWEFFVRLDRDFDEIGYEAKIQFKDSRFVSVTRIDVTSGPAEVTITPRKIEGGEDIIANILNLGTQEKSEISLDKKGTYFVRFSTTPVVQTEKTDENGKTIVVVNVAPVNYQKVSIVTRITRFNVRSLSDLKISSSGNEIDGVGYDANGNGFLDYARFDALVNKGGIDYDISYADETKKLQDARQGDEEPKEIVLSSECRQSMSCDNFDPCVNVYTDSNNYFSTEVFLDGTQQRICINNANTECYPAVRQVRKCSLSREAAGVPIAVSKIDAVDVEKGSQSLIVENEVTKEPFAILTVGESSLGEKNLDIVFVQSKEFADEFCYNVVLDADKGETGIDCGGQCNKCLEQGTNYLRIFAYALWAMFLIGIIIFLFDRKMLE